MIKNLFSFQGRLSRGRWWLVTIGAVVAEIIAVVIVAAATGASMDETSGLAGFGPAGIVIALVFFVAIWVNLATSVKRYHDRNKPGWWIFIMLVPVVGSIWYLVECGFLPGTSGTNQFGADPLTAA